MITSTKDLAEHLGLSRWTVSRVLNGHPEVKEETRRRVLDAARELGFSPNTMARGLRGGSTGLVGVCFQELESPALAKKTAFLQHQLRTMGFQGMIELTDGDPKLEESVLRHFLSLKSDGIILVGSTLHADNPTIQYIIKANVPTVLVDPIHDLPFPSIQLDRVGIMEKLVDHLWDRGHRQFALLGIESDPVLGHLRIEGIRRGVEKHNARYSESVSSYTEEGFGLQDCGYGYSLAKTILDKGDKATGWIAMNDRLAIGALTYLREKKMRVPEDLSVVGFDNLDISPWYDPPLTTVDHLIPKIFREAVAILIQAVQNPSQTEPIKQWILPELIVRKSS
jgi:DNA-binding LacI/PurR family transcriptional regulator